MMTSLYSQNVILIESTLVGQMTENRSKHDLIYIKSSFIQKLINTFFQKFWQMKDNDDFLV